MSNFIKVEGFYVKLFSYDGLSPKIRYLKGSEDSFGNRLWNGYSFLPDESYYWGTTAYTPDVTAGYSKRPLPLYLLYGEYGILSEGSTCYKNRNYIYQDATVHNRGLGFCGFARIRTEDIMPSYYIMSDKYYDPEKRGVLTQLITRDGILDTSPLLSSQVNTYDDHATAYGKQNPRLIQSVVSDNVRGVTDTTAITYGTYDYPSEIVSTKALNGSTARQTETKQCTYAHGTAPNKYVLGVVTEEALIKETDGNSTLSWKERVVTTYDTLYHPSNKKVYVGQYGRIWGAFHHHIDYDATNLVSETCWQYDARGNVISEMTAPYGATEFTGKSYTYDNDGRHVLSSTNALGQTTSYIGYNHWGKPTSSVDFRNHTTSCQYDSWGNLIRTTRPDGGETQTTATWGGEKCYYVTKTATGAPDQVLHYDGANREVRSGRKRFDGQWQYVDKEYDMQGNVSRVSLPFRGTSASYWNRYTYDHLNRPLAVVEASGKTTTWSYSGTSTTTVKEGITSTRTTDAGGRVVSVTDAGGTITYNLRDDGQPSSVTAPGNISTSFSYDEYGRRTQIVDPSAGTQTDAYVWNSDGSSSSTHTNPNGAVTTSLDKFGRTTSVTRLGDFSTSYTYNTDGLLTAEISTNGTRKSYSYDNLGRLATVRDSCSDGRFLTKELSYLTGSVLEQVSYSTQSGPIVDEIYNYAYGNLQSVTTDGNLTVWSLTAENALGQPTSVVTGTVSRTYGFNAYGIPSYRKMAGGILQDFEYSFNASTGNLSERYDVGNVTLERFYYDNLNRLADTDDRSINYANNGNITSMSDLGSMSYGSGYKLLLFDPDDGALVPDRQQSISYTCFNRPSVLAEGGRSAAFTYNADGDRVKMAVTDSTGNILTRYYLGGRYECDSTAVGITERLYLGGDAYSAPMVLQKVNSGSWAAYNIGRDYLGSVTHIATASGTLVAEYSYDPWGRLRDPETLEIYYPGDEPELLLGRGFTGHEHLGWFGLINMNARLYDPLLGRFLSPDPYVQAPDFTQNLNRYSYALNNPLKYTDKSGEVLLFGLTPFIFGVGNLLAHAIREDDLSDGNWAKNLFSGMLAGLVLDTASQIVLVNSGFPGIMGIISRMYPRVTSTMLHLNTASTLTSVIGGAIHQGWKGVANTGKIIMGNVYLDENKSFFGQVWEGISRHTWEYPQQALGYFWSSIRNCWAEQVTYFGGAVYVTNFSSGNQGVTLGSYMNVDNGDDPSIMTSLLFDDYLCQPYDIVKDYYQHEYGHTRQSKIWGPLYLPIPALFSLVSTLFNDFEQHNKQWMEVWAKQYAQDYFDKYYEHE